MHGHTVSKVYTVLLSQLLPSNSYILISLYIANFLQMQQIVHLVIITICYFNIFITLP